MRGRRSRGCDDPRDPVRAAGPRRSAARGHPRRGPVRVAGRAGIIVRGLYGEPPDLLLGLVEAAGRRNGVVGVDLAGGPTPHHAFGLADYAAAFRRAGDLGLGRTVHAGEGRTDGEIRVAIETLGAQRIGHGTTLLEDPAVVDLVLERGVIIEACPTSSVHTGVIGSIAEYPLPRWLDRGVRACVCADNTLRSATTAAEEIARVREIPGMDDAKIVRVIADGHAGAFRRSSAG